MNAFNMPGDGPLINMSADAVFGFRFPLVRVIGAIMVALLATAVSLGIAAYAGGLRGGTSVQRTMIVALACVAVLYVHLIPMCWRAFSILTRVAGGALWIVGIVVVMVGQVTFFVESQRDAGNQRAASVPVAEAPNRVVAPQGRGLAEIAGDRVQVVADLARIEARQCAGRCLTVAASMAKLNAQLAALDAEAAEAKRREVEEDRAAAQVERDDALRASLRADLVASQIASWLHTTASRLELALALASAVVLEGAAIVGWMLVSVVIGHERGRVVIATGSEAVVPLFDVVAPQAGITTIDRAACEGVPAIAATVRDDVGGSDHVGTTISTDEQLLEKIHDAVVAGALDPTQDSIRRLLRCRQPKAGRLNRLYQERFGGVQNRRAA